MKISVIFDERVSADKGGLLSHVDDVCVLNNLSELSELLTLVHVAPGIFKENRKRQDHLEQIEFVCLDFDDGTHTAKSVHDRLVETKTNHVIAGSKNYMVDKLDGKGPIERIHVFVPLSMPVSDPQLYKYICRKFADINYWSADKNCMEASRYYFKHSCICYEYNRGANLDINTFLKLQKCELKKQELNMKSKQFFTEPEGSSVERFKSSGWYKMLQNGYLRHDGTRYNNCSILLGVINKYFDLSKMEAYDIVCEFSTWGENHNEKSVRERIDRFIKR